MPVPPPFPMRPLALQYLVTGALDGVTPAPAFAVPPRAGNVVPPDNLLTQTVPNLGLVDLTGLPGATGQLADRIVKWVIIFGPNPPTSADNVAVAFDGVAEETEITIAAGTNGVYSRRCILVPQSGQLFLDGMAASPGDPIIVRLGVWMPQTRLELAAMIQACCCTAAAVDDDGDPAFFVDLPL